MTKVRRITDLPPDLRPADEERIPARQIPLQVPQEEIPPPPRPQQTNDREPDPFLRGGSD